MTSESDGDLEIACTLTDDEAMGQLDEWAALIADATRVERSDGHLRAVLPLREADRVESLAARERACCSFLTIAVVADEAADTVTVTVDSPTPAADEVVSFLGPNPS